MNDTPTRERDELYPWCFVDEYEKIALNHVFEQMIALAIEDKRGEMLKYAKLLCTGKDPAPPLKAVK